MGTASARAVDSTAVIIHVISDSSGDSGATIVAAAAAQFPEGSVVIKRLSCVTCVHDVVKYLAADEDANHPMAVFHTIVDPRLRKEIKKELEDNGIYSIDLLGPAITVLTTLTGKVPANVPGRMYGDM